MIERTTRIGPLWQLFRLRARGGFRAWRRQSVSRLGLLRTLATVIFLLLMMLPTFAAFFMTDSNVIEQSESTVTFVIDQILPIGLAYVFYINLLMPDSIDVLKFQPAEIDFLFGAPLDRRDLVSYKLLCIFSSTMAISLAFNFLLGGAFVFMDGPYWWAFIRGYIFLVLSLSSFRLVGIWTSLIRETALRRLQSILSRLVLLALATCLMIAMFESRIHLDLNFLRDKEQILTMVKTIIDSPTFQLAIIPFRVFTNLLRSADVTSFVLWGSLCVTLNFMMLRLVLHSDANFMESELRINQQRAQVTEKTKSIESAFATLGSKGTLPMLPRLNGAGPIAWRQLQTFYRSRKFLLGGLAFYFLCIFLAVSTQQGDYRSFDRFLSVAVMVGTLTFLCSLGMPIGFRSDIRRMAMLKSLPCSSFEICAGQLLGPVILISMVQLTTVVFYASVAIEQWAGWLAILTFGPLLATILISLINILALAYPPRDDEGVLNEFEKVGNILIFLSLFLITFVILSSVITAIGWASFWMLENAWVTAICCWLVTASISVLAVYLTSRSFDHFDVSRIDV